jgi:Na+/H+ antiporter NhaD/arsenite permease-like protein
MQLKTQRESDELFAKRKIPIWVMAVHLLLIGAVVATNHHIAAFMAFFLFFLGVAEATTEYQDELKVREALLVGYFLMGLVILGGLQKWWLQPTLAGMNEVPLFFGATGLTAVTDNAALTYLGSQVQGLSETSQYALLAGAVTGGGLTVIANAPNPAGFGILRTSFGDTGISPLWLFIYAIPATLVSAVAFLVLPNL